MTIKSYLWLLPFIFFIGGYYAAHRIFRPDTFATPGVVGKTLDQALILLSENGLNAHVIARKQTTDLPEGIVIAQSPADGQAIKTYQTVSLVISQQPSLKNTPSFIGMTRAAIDEAAKQAAITVTYAFVPSMHPTGSCCAQKPSPGQSLPSHNILVYCAADNQKPVLWPSCIGKPLTEVVTFLTQHTITPQITSQSPKKNAVHNANALIIDQYPRPGTLVTLSPEKQFPVALHIP